MTSQWTKHGLPSDLSDKTLIDVGCWEGEICVDAVKRNAAAVVGVDYCTSPDLEGNLKRYGFAFIQLDVLSEKFLELPEFDVVHCAGVLYHIENPIAFLFRLRKVCRTGGWLFLETTVYRASESVPVMLFHPHDSLDDNPSNWWSPNELCLREMLTAAGFDHIETVMHVDPEPQSAIGRIAVKAQATSSARDISQKILPRRMAYMPQSDGRGNRRAVKR